MGSIADGRWLTPEQKKALTSVVYSRQKEEWPWWFNDKPKRKRRVFSSIDNDPSFHRWEDDGGYQP